VGRHPTVPAVDGCPRGPVRGSAGAIPARAAPRTRPRRPGTPTAASWPVPSPCPAQAITCAWVRWRATARPPSMPPPAGSWLGTSTPRAGSMRWPPTRPRCGSLGPSPAWAAGAFQHRWGQPHRPRPPRPSSGAVARWTVATGTRPPRSRWHPRERGSAGTGAAPAGIWAFRTDTGATVCSGSTVRGLAGAPQDASLQVEGWEVPGAVAGL
jgi:hypothetical protein